MSDQKHYDVGIVGWWFASNFGSALTYYGLGKILEDMGYSSLMLQLSKLNRTPWEPEVQKTIDFMRKYFPISEKYPIEEHKRFNDLCDTFLLGSDQLWTRGATDLLGFTFFLDFAEDTKKRLAYATSFGHAGYVGSKEENDYIRYQLSKFDYISVREQSGVRVTKECFGVHTRRDLDPVFLCDVKHYDALAANASVNMEGQDYLFTYILDVNDEKQRAIQQVADKLGLRIISVLDIKSEKHQRANWHIGEVIEGCSIEDFVHYIKHCKFMITDSHHGACFAMIYNRDMITIANSSRGLTRFTSLFDLMALNHRLVSDSSQVFDNKALLAPVDYKKTNAILAKEKAISFERFKTAMAAKHKAVTKDAAPPIPANLLPLPMQPAAPPPPAKKPEPVVKPLNIEGKTIKSVPDTLCTGCGACYNVCPTDAIVMKIGEDGFSYPSIIDEKCIECGKCIKTCPVNEPQYKNTATPGCYAVMGNDAIRKVSSSGGVFSIVAEWIFKQGGVVCGAAFTKDCYRVEQVIVKNAQHLHTLRGAKYVQSDTGHIYREMKMYLENGVPVLFTGTPCQVAAVNRIFGQQYDHLYTMDLICHGVPSSEGFEKFIREKEQEYNSKAVRVSFRDKDLNGWGHSSLIEFENGQTYKKVSSDCAYMDAFMKLMSQRKSCGNCQFAKLPRQGDLTIADFWGVQKVDASYNDKKGTSLVLVNNDKGKRLREVLKKDTKLCVQAPLQVAIDHNGQITRSAVLHKERNRFCDLLHRFDRPFEKAMAEASSRHFDIGYVGWWYGLNYGSALSNFALHQVLTDMGKTVLMLDWPIVGKPVPEQKEDNFTRRFANHFYEQSLYCAIENYHRYNNHCDTFVVGSDQLWNWYSNRSIGTYNFFLDFVDDQHKKIAYATSFGHDEAYYPPETQLRIAHLLSRFDAISVREKTGVDICKNRYGIEAQHTINPVFLCGMNHWDKAIGLSGAKEETPYVLAYMLDPTDEKMEMVRRTAKEMNLPYRVIVDGQKKFEDVAKAANDPNVLENVEIADWLYYFRNASYVVTDSFHGFCFSILFNRSMTVIPNSWRGLTRFNSLCELTGLHSRCCNNLEEFEQSRPWENAVDFAAVSARMKPMIDYSRNWLETALNENDPTRSKSEKQLRYEKLLEHQDTISDLKKEVSELKQQLLALTEALQQQKG